MPLLPGEVGRFVHASPLDPATLPRNVTAAAGLSSRRPLKAAWRTMPAAVQPANSISATSSGRTQWMLAADRGNGGAAMDTDDEGQKAAAGIGPGSDDDLVPSAAFCLGPTIGLARAVGGIGLFRNNSFQRQLAGGEQDSITAGLEVIDVAQQRTPVVRQSRQLST
jgi:hypothetical protein